MTDLNNVNLIAVDNNQYGIPNEKAVQIIQSFSGVAAEMQELEPSYQDVISKEINPDICKEAGELRKRYVKIRTATSKIHKDEKAFYLNGGRYVDAIKNMQQKVSSEKEEELSKIEKYYELLEQERIEKLVAHRTKILGQFNVEGNGIPANIGIMTDEEFDQYVEGVKYAHIQRKKREEEEELARQKEIERQKQVELENEKLRKQLRQEQEERQRLERLERDRQERERLEREAEEQPCVVQDSPEDSCCKEVVQLEEHEVQMFLKKIEILIHSAIRSLGNLPTMTSLALEQDTKEYLEEIHETLSEVM